MTRDVPARLVHLEDALSLAKRENEVLRERSFRLGTWVTALVILLVVSVVASILR